MKKKPTDPAPNQPTPRATASIGSLPVTFRASIPPMETAIKIHGEGGARLQLDIAESDLAGFLPALVMRGCVLSVTLKKEG
jgi:hypothetical protein